MSLISMYKLFTTFYRDILISFFEIKLNVDSAILMNFNFVFTNNTANVLSAESTDECLRNKSKDN